MNQDFTADIQAEELVQKLFDKYSREVNLQHIGKKVLVLENSKGFMQEIFSNKDLDALSDGMLSDCVGKLITAHTFGNWRNRLGISRQEVRLGKDGIIKDTTKIGHGKRP